jgi:hypothetical protein
MATGDSNDMLARIRVNLPPWFPQQGSAPVLDGLLTGIASALAFVYSLYAYAVLQTRIGSATGPWLDLIAWDFFGARFLRNPGEADASFRGRILAELIRPRVTREAIQAAVAQLTGFPVRVIEPFMVSDTGFWKMRGSNPAPVSFYRFDTPANPARWSGRGLRCMFFIECVLPPTQLFGSANVPAWVMRGSGIVGTAFYIMRGGAGANLWGSPWTSRASAGVTGTAALFSLIHSMRAAGITCWLKFVPLPTANTWDQPGVTWDQPGVRWDH